MKAAVLHAPHDLRIEDIPTPQPGDNQVRIAVQTVGICGGDLHFYTGSHPYANYPRVHGHELAGRIDAVGKNVTLPPGTRVVLEPLLPCGYCYPCSIGRYNCCDHLRVVGAHVDGAFAEYVVADANYVHPVPDAIPNDHAATVEPYTIAAHGIDRAGVQPGEQVLVVGCGAIGLCLVDLLVSKKAIVTAADLSPYRLELARRMGAARIVNTAETDLVETIQSSTNGGMPVVFEATGVRAVMEMTERLVASAGRIVIIGLTNDPVTFTGINFTKREMSVLGSRNSAGNFPPVINAMAEGKLHPDVLITHRFPFEHITEAFKTAAADNSTTGKIIIAMA